MSYTVHQAKTNLSRLIKEAEEGKEVIIMRGKTPVARLVAFAGDNPVAKTVKTETQSPAGALEPFTEEELRELGLG